MLLVMLRLVDIKSLLARSLLEFLRWGTASLFRYLSCTIDRLLLPRRKTRVYKQVSVSYIY